MIDDRVSATGENTLLVGILVHHNQVFLEVSERPEIIDIAYRTNTMETL
jgi:hypothetical protein